LELIDKLAARQGRSRSSFVRRELQRIVAEYPRKEVLSKSRLERLWQSFFETWPRRSRRKR